jgi:hypothetical protein
MHITIKRTGGYAGGTEVANVDTSALDKGRATEIERLVADAGSARQREAVGADLMRYEITITNQDGKARVLTLVDDGTDGGPLKRLIEKLGG